MPRYTKTGDPRIDSGLFDHLADFYNVTQAQSSSGAVQRANQLAWAAYVNVAPYEGIELQDAQRIVGETWYTISTRYIPSRIPVEGMRLVIRARGPQPAYECEIRGVKSLGFQRNKVEMVCRKLT